MRFFKKMDQSCSLHAYTEGRVADATVNANRSNLYNLHEDVFRLVYFTVISLLVYWPTEVKM